MQRPFFLGDWFVGDWFLDACRRLPYPRWMEPTSPKPNRPPGWWHSLRYALDRTFKTGERRSEFEHKYRAHGDYFGYRDKPYELAKYQRTLDAVRAWRTASGSALEIGCSVGVFTAMLAREFAHVAAVDIAREALLLAEKQVGGAGDVAYVQGDLVSLDLGRTFDVIVCAEVLYYIREPDAPQAVAALERHLSPGGVIIEVTGQDRTAGAPKFFHHWDRVLGERFRIANRQLVEDPERPYEIVGYVRS